MTLRAESRKADSIEFSPLLLKGDTKLALTFTNAPRISPALGRRGVRLESNPNSAARWFCHGAGLIRIDGRRAHERPRENLSP
jgi:hypothetical protein